LCNKVGKRTLKVPFFITLFASVAGVLVKDPYTVKGLSAQRTMQAIYGFKHERIQTR